MDEKAGNVNKSSLFDEVLNRFNSELTRMDELSGMILERVSKFKDVRQPRPVSDGDKKERQPGFISDLENGLDTMNELNYVLSQAKDGLIDFVG